VSDKNHRAKYYELTAEGRQHLQSETAALRKYVSAVFKVLEPA
jgi:hypothetical protein